MSDPGGRRAALEAALREHGIEALTPIFVEHGVDLDVLADLDGDDLREMGLTLGDRKRVARLVASLRAPMTADAARPDEDRPVATLSGMGRPSEDHQPERRQVTVLFADLVESTSLSTRLDPEDLRSLIRAYHAAVADAVESYGGHVAQHLGDGAVAYFGWPAAHENDAERAVRAALEVVHRVNRVSTADGASLATRIGIATGPVVVGDLVENPESRERPVIGPTPNLAARLESLAPSNGIVISAKTRRMVGGLFEIEDLGEQPLKGFDDPIQAWRVRGEASASERFAALRGEDLSPLVGREAEQDRIRAAWDTAVGGRLRVVHLVAEAGMGKSRLTLWARELARASGAKEHTLSCSPYHSATAFHPLVGHLEISGGMSKEDDGAARFLKLAMLVEQADLDRERTLPVLAKLLQLPLPEGVTDPGLEPIQEKEVVLSAMAHRLRALSASQPLLLVVEDMHWIDPSTTEMLGRILSFAVDRPVLALLCYRPEYTPPSDLSAEYTGIRLDRLSPEACAQIVDAVAGVAELTAAVRERIIERADGVPLFVEELTKTMVETGLSADATSELARTGQIDHAIPETLHDSLIARLDRLGSVKRVAQVAACIGREFTRALVERVSGFDAATVETALDQLIDAGLVQIRFSPTGMLYLFRHALLQDAAYQSLLKATRIEIHGRIIDALVEEEGAAAPEILAHHAQEARRFEQAADHWLAAGQAALSSTAFIEAIQHFRAGLAALDELPEPDPVREVQLTVMLAVPLTLTRGWAAEEVGDAYRRAHELCIQLGQPPQTFPTLVGVFTYHLVRGEFDYAHGLAQSNQEVADASGDDELLLEAAHDRGTSAFYLGRLDEAMPALERALELYDPAAHAHHAFLYSKLPGPTALVHLAMAHVVRGEIARARSACDALDELVARGDHAFTRVWAQTGECIVHLHLRDVGRLVPVAEEMIAESKELGFPNWLAQGLVWLGWALARTDDPDGGIAMIREGHGIWGMTGAELMKPYLNVALLDALVSCDRVEEAEEVYRTLCAVLERTGERWCAGEAHRLGAEAARRAGDRESAERRTALARGAIQEMGTRLYALSLAADHVRAAGQKDRAAAVDALAEALAPYAGIDAPIVEEARALAGGSR